MQNRPLLEIALLVLLLATITAGCAAGLQAGAAEAEQLRQLEWERLRSFVEADLAVAGRLHADDFQLINPVGMPITKEAYLGDVGSGQLDYQAWEPGEIAVRLYGDAAVIRYQDIRFEVYIGGQLVHRGPMYHTNVYERRDGQWQAVWSQASGVITP